MGIQPDTKLTNPKDAVGSDKVPLHVLPLRVLFKVALAFLGGALKYGSHNYREAGVRASIYIDGIARHLIRFAEGEDDDPDVQGYSTGVRIHHLDELIAGAMVLRDSILKGNWTDDRAPFAEAGWIAEDNAMAKLMIAAVPNPVAPVTEASLRAKTATPSEEAGWIPPEKTALVLEPIPTHAYYSQGVFLHRSTHRPLSDSFHMEWHARRDEFPTEPWTAAPAYLRDAIDAG